MAKGFTTEELTAFAVGRNDIAANIRTLETRLGDERFSHKHDDYRFKLEQLKELAPVSARLREMGSGN